MSENYELWYRRMTWRVKRGSLEVNVILMAYLKATVSNPDIFKNNHQARQTFELFLDDHSDQQLWDWLVNLDFSADEGKKFSNYCSNIHDVACAYMKTHTVS